MKKGTIVNYFRPDGKTIETKTTSDSYYSGRRLVIDICGHKGVRECDVIEAPRSFYQTRLMGWSIFRDEAV